MRDSSGDSRPADASKLPEKLKFQKKHFKCNSGSYVQEMPQFVKSGNGTIVTFSHPNMNSTKSMGHPEKVNDVTPEPSLFTKYLSKMLGVIATQIGKATREGPARVWPKVTTQFCTMLVVHVAVYTNKITKSMSRHVSNRTGSSEARQ